MENPELALIQPGFRNVWRARHNNAGLSLEISEIIEVSHRDI